MSVHAGGCLCGEVRYEVVGAPMRTTICHCRFCQMVTGAAYMVEPIFPKGALRLTRGKTSSYSHRSSGSGKMVHMHFCPTCATKTHLTFERMPELCGVYIGTFDEPDWIPIGPESSRHIFIGVARPDTILPEGVETYVEHVTKDGAPQQAKVHDAPHVVGRRG